jgi:rod shape-determining protein MreD
VKRLLATGAILGLAVVAQSAIGAYAWRDMAVVDLVLVAVVFVALMGGPVAGILAGTCAGLVQDALSSGILGIGGLAKTLVGFTVGRVGSQFIVTGSLPRVLAFAAATAAHAVIFMGVYWVLGLRSFPNPLPSVAVQAIGNGLVGAIGFQMSEWMPRALERRRASRGGRLGR